MFGLILECILERRVDRADELLCLALLFERREALSPAALLVLSVLTLRFVRLVYEMSEGLSLDRSCRG